MEYEYIKKLINEIKFISKDEYTIINIIIRHGCDDDDRLNNI